MSKPSEGYIPQGILVFANGPKSLLMIFPESDYLLNLGVAKRVS